GGATLGLGAAALAALVAWLDPPDGAVLAAAAGAALVTAASDLRLFGFALPGHPRQVNELWLGKFRSWVYGSGFGWQIGFGFATYIMTGAVYLTVVLAALTGSPSTALLVCVAFGAVRALAILLGSYITTPERLITFHRRFDALGEPVRRALIGEQVAVATACASVWLSGVAIALTGVVLLATAV